MVFLRPRGLLQITYLYLLHITAIRSGSQGELNKHVTQAHVERVYTIVYR